MGKKLEEGAKRKSECKVRAQGCWQEHEMSEGKGREIGREEGEVKEEEDEHS